MFKDEANIQAQGSDFTGTSLAVLKGAKVKKVNGYAILLDVLFTGYLLKFLT